MSKVQMLRSLVKQRLTAAAEEIFGLFERTIAEYEEELCRSKEENERQRKLLDAVFNPQPQLNEGDVQQLLVVKEEVPPEQQEWSSSVDQEDPEPPHIKEDQEDPEPPHIKEGQEDPEPPHIKEDQEDPEPPHIKEEQEELWISQEGEQLQGLEEADITKFTSTPVPVKSEDDEEKPQSSQLHQRHTEEVETGADGEDCGGPEPARNSDPDTHLQPETVDKTGEFSEPETDDSNYDWKETREYQSGLNALKNDEDPVSDWRCSAGEKSFSCAECGKRLSSGQHLKRHMMTHTGERPFSCPVCKKSFTHRGNLQTHMRTHTGEKPFSCPVCKKSFIESGYLQKHMIIHTGEQPFSCSECGKRFLRKQTLVHHMRTHTGEKPFRCPECGKRFSLRQHLKRHMMTHTGEKPFSCSVCEKPFTERGNLQKHMRTHSAAKPFSCPVCKKSFTESGNLQTHMIIHTGEKLFSCNVCEQRFSWPTQFRNHQCVGCQSSQTHHSQTEENREAEPPASSSAQQMETDSDGEDCGGPEPARSSDPDTHLQPETDDKTGESSETDD